MPKDEAMKELPDRRDGAFVVRKPDHEGCFAMLTAIMHGKEHDYEIISSPEGLHLKKSSVMQPNLSALIAYYKHTQQKDLPQPLATW